MYLELAADADPANSGSAANTNSNSNRPTRRHFMTTPLITAPRRKADPKSLVDSPYSPLNVAASQARATAMLTARADGAGFQVDASLGLSLRFSCARRPQIALTVSWRDGDTVRDRGDVLAGDAQLRIQLPQVILRTV